MRPDGKPRVNTVETATGEQLMRGSGNHARAENIMIVQ